MKEVDCAFVDSGYDITPKDWIANPDFSDPSGLDVTGIETDASLENHIGDQNRDIYVQGRMSNRTSTYVDGVIKNSAGEVKAVVLEQEETEDGDSGGPIFLNYDSNKATICGSHGGEFGGILDTDSYGTTAETIEDTLDGQFLKN